MYENVPALEKNFKVRPKTKHSSPVASSIESNAIGIIPESYHISR